MKMCIKRSFVLPVLVATLGSKLVGQVAAQTFTTLHSFTGGGGGAFPTPQASKTMRFLRSFFALLMLPAAPIAYSQSNFVMFISSPGDYIGEGQTYVTANPADFAISGPASLIRVDALGFYGFFAGPDGTNLEVGPYTNCAMYPVNGSSPGMEFFGPGRGCDRICGSFEIKEIHTNDNGQVDRLWCTFTNNCECFPTPMVGEVRFNSQLADLATLYLSCPSNILVDAPLGTNSMVVNYPAAQATPGAWITSIPPSGSVFPAGSNTVLTTFVYGTNKMTCTFDVIVWVPPSTTVTLKTPKDGALLQAGDDVQLMANAAADPFNIITSVAFLSSSNILGVVTNPPYSLFWSNVSLGTYTLQAIAENSSGVQGTSAVAKVTVAVSVLNGGFETGDFTGWTVVGTPPTSGGSYNAVLPRTALAKVVHSGFYGAYLGDVQVASLSQSLWTVPAQYYLLSFWLENPVSGTNQFFSVSWNTNSAGTNVLLGFTNPPAFSWSKYEFLVMGSGTNITLQILAENDPGYFGLDDITLTPIPLPTLQSPGISTNGCQLSWLTASGVTYQVQYKTNLLQPGWNELIPAFVATDTNSTTLDTNSVSSSKRFYRLVIP